MCTWCLEGTGVFCIWRKPQLSSYQFITVPLVLSYWWTRSLTRTFPDPSRSHSFCRWRRWSEFVLLDADFLCSNIWPSQAGACMRVCFQRTEKGHMRDGSRAQDTPSNAHTHTQTWTSEWSSIEHRFAVGLSVASVSLLAFGFEWKSCFHEDCENV